MLLLETINIPCCKPGIAEPEETFPPCDQIESSACGTWFWLLFFSLQSVIPLIYPIHPSKCWQEDSDLNSESVCFRELGRNSFNGCIIKILSIH